MATRMIYTGIVWSILPPVPTRFQDQAQISVVPVAVLMLRLMLQPHLAAGPPQRVYHGYHYPRLVEREMNG